jgi:hypothetical protein
LHCPAEPRFLGKCHHVHQFRPRTKCRRCSRWDIPTPGRIVCPRCSDPPKGPGPDERRDPIIIQLQLKSRLPLREDDVSHARADTIFVGVCNRFDLVFILTPMSALLHRVQDLALFQIDSRPITQGSVLYFDFENGPGDVLELIIKRSQAGEWLGEAAGFRHE